jgi:uncharacterized protein GlcG (DUF336 family)
MLFSTLFLCVARAETAKEDRATYTPSLTLSPSLAVMNEAIRVCTAKGYRVTVTIVDLNGVVKLQGRSDGSPIHSLQFSFRKAYTMVSMGPMLSADRSSAIIKALSASPQGLTNVQSGETPLLFLPGAALININNIPVGAIGVSGAPSSFEDEACALAGVAMIKD